MQARGSSEDDIKSDGNEQPIPFRRQSMKAARGIHRAAVRFFLVAAMFGAAVPMASAQDAQAARPAGGASGRDHRPRPLGG